MYLPLEAFALLAAEHLYDLLAALLAAEPLYDFLKSQKGGILTSDVKWNFTKFLVGKDGEVVKRWVWPCNVQQTA